MEKIYEVVGINMDFGEPFHSFPVGTKVTLLHDDNTDCKCYIDDEGHRQYVEDFDLKELPSE